MEEKSNTSSEKDFAFTKRQVSFMYEYWYENDLIDDCFNEEGITEIAIYKHDGKEIIDEYSTLVNPEIPIPPFKDDCWNNLIEDANLGMDMKYSTGTTTASFDLVKKRIFDFICRWL